MISLQDSAGIRNKGVYDLPALKESIFLPLLVTIINT